MYNYLIYLIAGLAMGLLVGVVISLLKKPETDGDMVFDLKSKEGDLASMKATSTLQEMMNKRYVIFEVKFGVNPVGEHQNRKSSIPHNGKTK